MTTTFQQDLGARFAAGQPGVWITTHEELRAIPVVLEMAKQHFKSVSLWSCIRGLTSADGTVQHTNSDEGLGGVAKFIADGRLPSPWLITLCDAHDYLKPQAVRAFREIMEHAVGHFIVISPKSDALPLEWQRIVTPMRFALPTEDELAKLMSDFSSADLSCRQLAEASLGLTMHEAKVAASMAISRHGLKNLPRVVHEIWDSKAKTWADSGLVVVNQPKETWNDVGGCFRFKDWIEARISTFSAAARQAGVPTPRGVLFTGPYGVGKSLLSKVIANRLGWRYVEWNLSSVFGPFVGQTEEATSRLIETTESLRPCVVRIDEMAHQLAGFESSGFTDSGVVSRLIGTLLTWLEERKDGIFVVGNTNEPWRLPPHVIRSGRFDGVFNITLPAEDTLEEILTIHVRKYASAFDLGTLDLRGLCKKMAEKGFSGADVEQSVVEAVQVSYPKAPTAKALTSAIHEIVPSSSTMKEQVSKLQEWARTRTREA